MAQFPIQKSGYSPSGSVGAVRANLNVDTGAGLIGQGLERLGEVGMRISERMQAANEKVQNANDAMDLSKLNRQSDEADKVLYDSLSKETDPEKQQKMIADHEQVLPKLGEQYNERVKGAYERGLNDSIVSRRTKWEGYGLQVRAKAAEDKGKFEVAALMAQGKEAQVQVVYENMLTTGVMGSEEYKAKTSALHGDVQLVQLEQLARTKPNEAMTQADKIDTKSFSVDQLKHLDELRPLMLKESARQTALFENNLADNMIKADSQKDATPIQFRDTANSFREQIKNSNLAGTDKMKLLKSVTTWEKDEGSINYAVINSLNQRIDQYIQSGVADQTLQADINAAKLDGSFGSRNGIVSRDSAAMLKRLNSAEYKTAYAATSDIRAQLKSDAKEKTGNAEEIMYLFDKDLREEFSKNPPNDAQAVQYAQTRASFYKNMAVKQTEELMNIRASGQGVVPWADLPRAQQERDLFILAKPKVGFNQEVGWFTMGGTEVVGSFTKNEIKKAQEIWGNNKTVTDEMIKQFSDYLVKQNRPHFAAGSKEPLVLNDAQRNALPSKTIYVDKNGIRRMKP